MNTGNQFLDRLTAEDLGELAQHFTRVELPQNQVLFEPDDPIEHVHFLTSGTLSVVVVLSDGRTVESAMIGREGVVGSLVHAGPIKAFGRGIMQIGGAGERISAERFREVVERRPKLWREVDRYTALLQAELQQNVACNAVHRLEQRLSKWLLRASDRVGDQQLNLTQEFIGDMLGAQRTTVTQVAGELQRRGLILYQRGKVVLQDRAGLERMACECYRAAQRRADELRA